MGKKRTRKITPPSLLDALTRAYVARAKLFHTGVRASEIDLLIAEIDAIETSHLEWTKGDLGISPAALAKVQNAGGMAHQVFAHPEVIRDRPHLIAYYRNIATISQKGIGQLLFSTGAYESGRKQQIDDADALKVCTALNRIVSGVIEALPEYAVALSRQTILAEIGAELQGSWANAIGSGAAKAVRGILCDYIQGNDFGTCPEAGDFTLKNGWRIVFASEPDVAFFDAKGTKQIAIEIKGSLDVAGAQTRYGETKKSFAKQLAENPRCHTVYLASCFTDAVIEQIKRDGQVRDYFNLTSILYDASEKKRFLNRVFHIVKTPA